MIDLVATAFHAALATEGFPILLVAVILAGLVRGFSGFGTAMIYMPFAGTVLPPVWAVITMLVFDIPGTMPILRDALKDSHRKDLQRLIFGAVVALPFGLFLLSRVHPDVFRWSVSSISLVLLMVLITGWRYRGVLSRKMTVGVGAMGGFLSGASGVAGPPVILLYMSSRHAIQVIRANVLLYLFMIDALTLTIAGVMGLLDLVPISIGLILTIPYALANMAGAALFRPDKEKLFRAVAYVLIAVSALSNLPLFG